MKAADIIRELIDFFALNLAHSFRYPLFLMMITSKFHLTIPGEAIDKEWDMQLTSPMPKFVKNR
jgi:hypothetical protein